MTPHRGKLMWVEGAVGAEQAIRVVDKPRPARVPGLREISRVEVPHIVQTVVDANWTSLDVHIHKSYLWRLVEKNRAGKCVLYCDIGHRRLAPNIEESETVVPGVLGVEVLHVHFVHPHVVGLPKLWASLGAAETPTQVSNRGVANYFTVADSHIHRAKAENSPGLSGPSYSLKKQLPRLFEVVRAWNDSPTTL